MTSTREHEQGSWSTTTVLLCAFVVSIVLTALAVFCLGWLRFQDPSWLWNKKQQADQLYDVFRSAVTLVGVVGIAVGGALAFRRQQVNEEEHDRQVARDEAEQTRDRRDHERGVTSALRERFVVAAEQMGANTLSQRLAGVYAMAGTADDWLCMDDAEDARRKREAQTCIDVLCAYLRAAQPDPNPMAQDGTASADDGQPWDIEVRQTIVRVIASRLTPEGSGAKWSFLDFDFTGAHFAGRFDFHGADFSGGRVSFDGAKFYAGLVTFAGATFSGGAVTFNQAEFSGGAVTFRQAKFSGGAVTFDWADFSGSVVNFDSAEFSGGAVTFRQADFSGGFVTFDQAKFSGGLVDFGRAVVSDGFITFRWAEFSGGVVTFDRTQLSGGCVDFDGVAFSGGAVTFHWTEFSGGVVTFTQAGFLAGVVDFNFAEFAGGAVTFNETSFSGGVVTFNNAKFSAGQVTGPWGARLPPAQWPSMEASTRDDA